jgi:hypothetical protein
MSSEIIIKTMVTMVWWEGKKNSESQKFAGLEKKFRN